MEQAIALIYHSGPQSVRSSLEFLKQRAKGFYDVSVFLLNKGDYALSAFNIEQAVQLELKHFIGTRLGDFPKTHSLKILFQECMKLCPSLKDFYEANINLIGEIEDAYIMTRYYETKYEEREVRNMITFYVELSAELEKCKK